ncbi:hypothetical protein FCULG_00007346 [Fusarium culmorum]|uniref:Uncharacterized protein n=1 Tax=Fusarium culmorum TaxID=5516 RepID=A0A2T4H248_FUSCU|nr:hypothetical protein FCULG_00007346 [Fusarium culmorum]
MALKKPFLVVVLALLQLCLPLLLLEITFLLSYKPNETHWFLILAWFGTLTAIFVLAWFTRRYDRSTDVSVATKVPVEYREEEIVDLSFLELDLSRRSPLRDLGKEWARY